MNKIKWSKKQNPNSWDTSDVKKVDVIDERMANMVFDSKFEAFKRGRLEGQKQTVTREWVEILSQGIVQSGKQGIKVLEEALSELGIAVKE